MGGRYLDMSGAPTALGFKRHALYERAPVTSLFRVLNQSVERQWYRMERLSDTDTSFCMAHVYGPPGTGKSSAVWKWAMGASQATNCPFAYIKCDTKLCLYNDPAAMSDDVCGQTNEIYLDGLEAKVFPSGTRRPYRRSICVFDQALANNLDATVVAVILRLVTAGIATVLVSSEGVDLNAGSFNTVDVVDYRFPGWTLDEFMCACQDESFFNSIKVSANFGEDAPFENRKHLLEQKFFLAGYSARFMFQYSDVDIKSKLNAKIAAFDPTIDSLKLALRSPKCYGAVSTVLSWHDLDSSGQTPVVQAGTIHAATFTLNDALVAKPASRTGYDTNNCFVSQYAGQRVVETLPTRSDALRSMGMHIKEDSVIGYGFQQRFRELLDEHEQVETGMKFLLNGETEYWPVVTVGLGDTLEDMESNTSPGTWFWCVGNTAAYDAIYIYADRCIRFIQVTAGKKHSFKIYAVDSILRSLKNRNIEFTNIDFVVVRPGDDTRTFTLDTPDGSLHLYRDFHGARWARGANCRNQVRYATVEWS